VFEELILVGMFALGASFLLFDLVNLITEKKHSKKRKTPLNKAKTGSLQNDLELVNGNPAKLPVKIQQISVKRRKLLLHYLSRIKNLPNRFRKHQQISSKPKKKTFDKIKRAGMALIFTIIIISTFFLVMRNNTRYLNQITIVQGQGYHESLRSAYLFLEGYAEEQDRIMTHQINWGKWYTKFKFTFIGMLHTWGKHHIWFKINQHYVNYVVISEWDSFHPFEVFEESEYARNFTILWSFTGTMGFRTSIYVVK